MLTNLQYNNFDFSIYGASNISELFLCLCKDSLIDEAQYIYNYSIEKRNKNFIECFKSSLETKSFRPFLQLFCNKRDIRLTYSVMLAAFNTACDKNNLTILQWLLEISPKIYNTCDKQLILKNSCLNGYIDQAKLFVNSFKDIDISHDNEIVFRCACRNGHVEIVKWLLSIKTDIDVSFNNEYCFTAACEYGYYRIAKLLYEYKSSIHTKINSELPLTNACLNDHLKIAKWLMVIEPNRNISVNNDYIFRKVCENGHLRIAKWLLHIKPNINIYSCSNYAFLHACANNCVETAKLLKNLNPSYFYLSISMNRIIDYRISSKLIILKNNNLVTEIKMCSICFEIGNVITQCCHVYCYTCISNWYARRRNCPNCRRQIEFVYYYIKKRKRKTNSI